MKVLLVIDMLNDFIRPDGALFCSQPAIDMVPYVASVIDRYRETEEPIFFIADAHDPDDIEFERFPAHCVRGTKGAQVIRELSKENDQVIEKKRYSAFFATDLEERLRGLAPDGDLTRLAVEIVGVCTNICVLYTVEELRNRDIPTTVYKDGVATFDDETQEWALTQMSQVLGAKIV